MNAWSGRMVMVWVVALMMIGAPLWSQSSPWQPIGPYGGRIAAIAEIGGVLVIAPDHNGLFRSTDRGDHWSRVDYPFQNRYITQLLVHDSTLFALGSDGYRSTDKGASWQRLASIGAYFGPVACFIGDTLFAAPHGGDIHRSTNMGREWTIVGHAPGGYSSILAAHGTTLYFSADSGLYRSFDRGGTWSPVVVTPTGRSVRAFAAHDSTIVLSIGDQPGVISDRLYRSSDNGATWSPAGTGVGADRINSIVWDGHEFFACGGFRGGVFRSTDGATWSSIQGGFTDEIAAFRVSGETMYAGSGDGSDGGLYRSLDRGATWTRINDGWASRSFRGIASYDGDLFATAGSEGIFKSSDNGGTWSLIDAAAFSFDAVGPIVGSYNALVAGMVTFGLNAGGMYRSTDHGVTWGRVYPRVGGVWGLTADGNFLFAVAADRATQSPVPCFSTDGGATWTDRAAEWLFGGDVHIATAHGVLFVGTSHGLYRSLDTGATWIPANGNPGEMRVTAVGRGDNVVLTANVTTVGAMTIARSTDNGDTWQTFEPTQGRATINDFTAHGSTIFAATYGGGILRSTDNGISWNPFNDGLPYVDVALVTYHNGGLFAGVNYGGMYHTSSPLGVERGADESGEGAAYAYPNPCSSFTTIHYVVPNNLHAVTRVNIAVCDATGRVIRNLVDARQTPGTYLVRVDAGDMAPGAYFCTVQIGTDRRACRFVVLGD